MQDFAARSLSQELIEAKGLLERALAILDAQAEHDAACCVCEAIERLIGAPSTLEQWHLLTR